ncbi:DnaE-like DNA polymerase III [Gordonia phage LittleFella]|nr:DnaE-like DNA polymerase III [Gordonia phage LittleFella]
MTEGHDATLDAVILAASPEHQKLLRHWVKEGWKYRKQHNPTFAAEVRNKKRFKEYKERLNYELQQIQGKGFDSYFLMLSDAVRWAKDNRIPVGPARGSAAASLVAYLLRITEINPMQFPTMLFARFIDPNRLDLPDVDLDFADDRRDEVRRYLVRKYGADRVGNIGNFTRYRGKNSIDDIARVYRIPKWAAEGVKGLIVERSGGDARQSESLSDTFEMFPKAKEFADMFPELRKAELLEGNYRGLGVHAAGIVISNTPIDETCALYTRPKAGSDEPVSVIAYDKKDSEYLGLLKADFLGLTTMGMIGKAIDMIGMTLDDLYSIPITEPDTLQAFADNNLIGVFQFEGRATAIVNRDVGPENFSHLADINALSRPGPLFSGMTAKYVAVKHGREAPERLHPVVDALTGWTYGQIVYQEQVLSIVKDLAGFPIERVGDIRRIISQKLGQMAMANALEEFIEGCRTAHGVKPELARRIWDFIATSSTYSFNQSHSVSYAMLAFWCMYLKIHYPKEFYAASLSKIGNGKSDLWKRGRMILDAQKNGIPVLPPSLTKSEASWSATPEGVRGGFQQITGIGPKTSETIIGAINGELCTCGHDMHPGLCTFVRPWGDGFRQCKCEGGERFRATSWYDLAKLGGVGAKTVESIVEFVTSHDPYQVNRTGEILDAAREAIAGLDVEQPTHHSTSIPNTGEHDVAWLGMVRNMNFKDYVEATRTRTGRDEDEIIANMKDPHLRKSCVLQCYDEGDEDVYVRINRWRYPDVEADLEEIVKDQDVILAIGRKREDFGISIHAEAILVMKLEDE